MNDLAQMEWLRGLGLGILLLAQSTGLVLGAVGIDEFSFAVGNLCVIASLERAETETTDEIGGKPL
jgi:hypothetical protein